MKLRWIPSIFMGVLAGCGTSACSIADSGGVPDAGATSPSESGGAAVGGPDASTEEGTTAPGDAGADASAPVAVSQPDDSGPDITGVPTDAGQLPPVDGGTTPEPASSFRCGNWADMRDNFVNGNLQLSGLNTTTDTYAVVRAKADSILAGFQTIAGANAVRIPINEPTALGTWWSAYKGVIDSAVARGMRVLVAYWAWHNGIPDSIPPFYDMWDMVVNAYANDNLVYFQIFNEPHGYSGPDFIALAVQWIARYPNVPRGRIIVAGTGYDGVVTLQGADPRLYGTLLSLHIYPFSNSNQTSTQAWRTMVQANLGAYASRTIVTEWGAPMTQGADYSGPGDGNNATSFMTGLSGYLHDNNIGSCYWPMLRIGDPWSLTTLSGTGANLSLTVTNVSGLARVKSTFGL